jgi:hypothetical protein
MVTPWCVQAAATAMKAPVVVRAMITPFFTSDPPLIANAPEETSTVKLIGCAALFFLQAAQATISKVAEPPPTCSINSLRVILKQK